MDYIDIHCQNIPKNYWTQIFPNLQILPRIILKFSFVNSEKEFCPHAHTKANKGRHADYSSISNAFTDVFNG